MTIGDSSKVIYILEFDIKDRPFVCFWQVRHQIGQLLFPAIQEQRASKYLK